MLFHSGWLKTAATAVAAAGALLQGEQLNSQGQQRKKIATTDGVFEQAIG